jgi:hypothetical protein
MNDFEKLIEEKKQSDRKQRKTTFLFILLSLAVIAAIYLFTINTKKANDVLSQKLDTVQVIKDSLSKKLNDTLSFMTKELKSDIIECIGIPTGRETSNGLPLYEFTLRITDTSIISSLKKVDYYFADDSYHPKLKSSDNPLKFFGIKIPNSWGCMPTVPIYLHFKDNSIDTILFPMCNKAKLKLPQI